MEPRIETLNQKTLVGKRMTMSFSNNKTFELWKSFMPHKKEIQNVVGTDLFSVEIYNDTNFFKNFNPNKEFEKWAAVEISELKNIPDEMEPITIPKGLYAVFSHKGPASEGPKTYQYIFGTWLPNSKYVLDNRPHLAIMGEKYKNNSPDSEEELWIPIKTTNG